MSTIGQRILRARMRKGLTQQNVAKHFGINRVSVANWESGATKPAIDKLEGLSNLLGGDADWYLHGKGTPPSDEMPAIPSEHTAPAAVSNAQIGERVTQVGFRVPVYGQAVGGADGEFVLNGNHLYDLMAPPSIAPSSGAYAVTVSGESMAPRYEDGEIAFVDPRRRPRRGSYVVAQIQLEEHGPILAFVKRFVRHNADGLVLEQFNPAKELRFDHQCVRSVHCIVMAGES